MKNNIDIIAIIDSANSILEYFKYKLKYDLEYNIRSIENIINDLEFLKKGQL